MSKIGMVGMGKLGAPVAYTFASKGHEVVGYDTNPAIYEYLEAKELPYQEQGMEKLLHEHQVALAPRIGDVIAHSDLVFVAVQTPHEPLFEGVTSLPEKRKDFDYTYLKRAVADVALSAHCQRKEIDLAVISTVLPGTVDREIRPNLTPYTKLVYNPMFIAMGTVNHDVLHPEFVLAGVDQPAPAERLEAFYSTIHDRPMLKTDIKTAEGIKVSYNTWITAKTVIANVWGELSHKLGMNFDDMYQAWGMAGERLISTKYMQAGMSDGGGCHPRDNIALSWLAREVGLSHDIFGDLMEAREDFESWHAELAVHTAKEANLPLTILGKAFKAETNIKTGSPSVLMANLIQERHGIPFTHVEAIEPTEPGVYFIGTGHEAYAAYRFPAGSTVLDPFGIIPDQSGVEVIRIGRR